MPNTCDTCKWFNSETSSCHRLPPNQPERIGRQGVMRWPEVMKSDHCGEHATQSSKSQVELLDALAKSVASLDKSIKNLSATPESE